MKTSWAEKAPGRLCEGLEFTLSSPWVLASRRLHDDLMVASRNIHTMGLLCRYGEVFAGASRALSEDFVGCKGPGEALRGGREAFTKLSPITTRTVWSLFEGFAWRSWGIHLGSIRQITAWELHEQKRVDLVAVSTIHE